jgi:hypothetical protein
MLRFNVYSYYDHFPDRKPVKGEPVVNCYVGDFCATEKIKPNSIAIMFEPRSIEQKGYRYVEQHPEKFKYIFTHDSELLKLQNSRFLMWGVVWCKADVPKTKGISIISSHKECCELHKARTMLAKQFEQNSKVDCFGTYNDPEGKKGWVDTYDAHAEYKFAIAMENYIDDYWFTEKILNCFSTRTVPIYYGARKINEFFDADGIIRVDDWHDIPRLVEELDIYAEYDKRKGAIERNYHIAIDNYGDKWQERFIREHGKMLEEIACIQH